MYASDIRVLRFIDEQLTAVTEKIRTALPDAVWQILLELQPVTQTMVSYASQNGGNILGLERVIEDGQAVMFLIAVTADTAANQEIIMPLVHEYKAACNEFASSLGLNKEWIYVPYAWADQNPLSKYGAENVALMQDVSERYDPSGHFQILRHSGFKIPSA